MKTSDFTSLVESLEMARGLQVIATDQDEDYRIDEELPARCVLESILEQLETGNVEAHTWSEIVSLREEDRERRKGKAEPCFDIRTNGTFSKRSRRVLGRMPMDKDELREKFAIWCNAWDLLKIQGPSRRAVQGFNVSHLDAHLKWLFSERVLRRTITVGTKKTAPPTWDFFLEFEHRLRKEAARAMARKKIPLVDALALVRADESLYNGHFSSGLSLITKFLDIKDAPTDSKCQREREKAPESALEKKVSALTNSRSTRCSTEERFRACDLSRCSQSKVSAATEEGPTTFGTSPLS